MLGVVEQLALELLRPRLLPPRPVSALALGTGHLHMVDITIIIRPAVVRLVTEARVLLLEAGGAVRVLAGPPQLAGHYAGEGGEEEGGAAGEGSAAHRHVIEVEILAGAQAALRLVRLCVKNLQGNFTSSEM